VHHRDPEKEETSPVNTVVARIEAEFARAMRSEDLEQVVGRDFQRVDLRLLDRGAQLITEGFEELTVKIDLDQRRGAPWGMGERRSC
jgi:hypothetical protein